MSKNFRGREKLKHQRQVDTVFHETRCCLLYNTRPPSSIMRVLSVVFLLTTVGSCLCVNEIKFEGNIADNYDNEIVPDQQEGESLNAGCHADLSRWDKLFISLEDSHMKQNMLLESVRQCCGGMVSAKAQVEKLLKSALQQYIPSLGSSCRAQADLRLHDSMVELRREEADRERRINATLKRMLHSGQEENARLKRLEESLASLTAESQPTPRPGGWSTSGMKPLLSDLKGMTSPSDVDAVKGSLVAIATELQKVHLQLSEMMDQAGPLSNNQGDT
uniref:Pentraxin 3, long b n=1 Tax=Nothobranchius kuhntae TaxID=321403 RepID=A0A1A8IM81_NOTKU